MQATVLIWNDCMDEIPIFPGIPIKKLIGKKFETLALHLHRIIDGRMKQNFHIEDWQTAVNQMVNDKPPPDFGFDRGYLNFYLSEAPSRPLLYLSALCP